MILNTAPNASFGFLASSQFIGLGDWTPSPTGTLLIGAVLGLLVFAFSYAFRVVSARQVKTPGQEASRGQRLMRLAGMALIGCGVLLGLAILNTGSDLRSEARLESRDLFAVMPRVGLFPEFIDSDKDVKAHDPVVRFLKVDDVKSEIRQLEEQRDRLENELALLEARPLPLDATITAEFQRAEVAVKSLDSQARDLVDEQAVLARELASRKLERDTRRLALEKELRTLDNDIDKVRTRLSVADAALADAQSMLNEGLISRRDYADREHDLEMLRNAMQGLREQRYMLEVESAELDSLYERSESSYEVQLALRSEFAEGSDERREEIVMTYRDAALAMDRERNRAARQRELEIDNLKTDLRDCKRRLEDPMGAAVVSAPWAGRIGYRDPSPMSRLPGQGPLLVMYRPGTIWADVPVMKGERVTPNSECWVHWDDPQTGRKNVMNGRVLEVGPNDDNKNVARVAFDPPAPVVVKLAMDKPVVVRVAISQDEAASSTLTTAAALVTIPMGLFLLLGPKPRRRSPQAGEKESAPGDQHERPRRRRPERKQREARGQVQENTRSGFAAGGTVAAGVGAMEYRPQAPGALASGQERLLTWLPSAILAHDLPRQVMARLTTLDATAATWDPQWAELEAEDVRAAALNYITRMAGSGHKAGTLKRMARELEAYCDIIDELTEIDGSYLRVELMATLNGAMLAAAQDRSSLEAPRQNLDQMRGQA
jgi:hypothetical protein